MNKVFLSWMDFLVKCLIVSFGVYVVINNFFLTDIRYMAQRIGTIEAMVQYTYNQNNQLLQAVQNVQNQINGMNAKK